MKKITVWSVLEKGGFVHNHVADGWAEGDAPVPISDIQKGAWKNSKWLKYWGYQDGQHLVEKTLQV